MSTVQQLLSEFMDAWTAGERPDVDAYVARADASDRDDLTAQLGMWLEIAPTPDYSEEARAEIAREPALVVAFEQASILRSPLASRLPTMRERAGLAVRDVAQRLGDALGFTDTVRAEAYLMQLERDELDTQRLSKRLLDGLASVLAVDRAWLVPGPPAAAHGQVFFRADDADAAEWVAADLDVLSRAAAVPAPDGEPMDELDRLFLGGPEG